MLLIMLLLLEIYIGEMQRIWPVFWSLELCRRLHSCICIRWGTWKQ